MAIPELFVNCPHFTRSSFPDSHYTPDRLFVIYPCFTCLSFQDGHHTHTIILTELYPCFPRDYDQKFQFTYPVTRSNRATTTRQEAMEADYQKPGTRQQARQPGT